MANVPLYGQQKVTQQKLPGTQTSVTVSPEAMGGGVAKGISNLGDEASKYYLKQKQDADEAVLIEANRKTSQAYTQIELDVKNLKGKDALGAFDYADKKTREFQQEIDKSFTNDTQRLAYKKWESSYRNSLNRSAMIHADDEHKKYVLGELDALATSEFNRLELNPDRQDVRDDVTATLGGLYDKKAKLEGIAQTDARYETGLKDVASTIHKTVINSFLAKGHDRLAKEYFTENKSAMKDIAALEKELETSSTLGEGMRAGYGVWSEMGPKKPTDLLDRAAMETKLEEILKDDPKALKIAKGALHEKISAFRDSVNAFDEHSGQGLEKILSRGGSLAEAKASKDWANLRPDSKLKWAQLFVSGPPVQTDVMFEYRLKRMETGSQAERDAFKNMNLYVPEIRGNYNLADWKAMTDRQMSMRRGETKIGEGIQTGAQIADRSLTAIGIDPTPKESDSPSSDAVRGVIFRKVFDERISAETSRKGGDLTSTEMQQIADALIIEVITQRNTWWLNQTKRLFETAPGEAFEVDFDEIPATEVAKITDSLKKNNVPVTNEKIVEIYRRKLERIRGK